MTSSVKKSNVITTDDGAPAPWFLKLYTVVEKALFIDLLSNFDETEYYENFKFNLVGVHTDNP